MSIGAPEGIQSQGVEDEETGAQTFQTPLERICPLPEYVTDRELTANQKRARFITRDIREYAERPCWAHHR